MGQSISDNNEVKEEKVPQSKYDCINSHKNTVLYYRANIPDNIDPTSLFRQLIDIEYIDSLKIVMTERSYQISFYVKVNNLEKLQEIFDEKTKMEGKEVKTILMMEMKSIKSDTFRLFTNPASPTGVPHVDKHKAEVVDSISVLKIPVF